jgi:DNA primase
MDAVEDIKSKLDIEDVVAEYVQLKRAGRNFRGLSPFTSERTPSFMVSPEKGIWHDFSSGKGGNIFSFIMEMEGVDFKTALEILARKAGVDLAQYGNYKSGGNGNKKERLYEALELAAKFYQVQFTKNSQTIDYIFKERAFSKETALSFQLGYAPNTGTALLSFLSKKGFNPKEIQDAGLATRNYRGPSDMFRGRLMIPLADGQGRIIGFTARLLDDNDDGPKYINTPQTLVYDKSRHIYGLHLAKEGIRKTGYVVVCEGNLDVIASHQAGVKNVVATAGTALTEQHLKGLANLTTDVRLAFDKDAAGQTATERSIPIASKVGVNLSIISITGAKDPDELIKKDPKAWKEAVNNQTYALDWLIKTYSEVLNLNEVIGKRKFTDIIVPIIAKLEDPVEKDHYLIKLADLVKTSKDSLISKTNSFQEEKPKPLKKTNVTPAELDKNVIEHKRSQDQLLALALIDQTIRESIHSITNDMLIGNEAQFVLAFLKASPDFKGDPLSSKELSKKADYVKMLLLQYEALYQDLDETELIYEAKRLQDRLIRKYVKQQKDALSFALSDANDKQTQNLLNQVRELDNLLKEM